VKGDSHVSLDRLAAGDHSDDELAHIETCPQCWYDTRHATDFPDAPPVATDGHIDTRPALDRYTLVRWIGLTPWGPLHEARDDKGQAVEVLWTSAEAHIGDLPRHPGIARVIEAHLDEDPPWLVREFVAGESLWEHLDRDGVDAVGVLLQVFLALQALHDAGTAHGALTANAIRVERGGRVVLTDVGMAPGDLAADREAFTRLLRRASRLFTSVEEAAAAENHGEQGAILRAAAGDRRGRYLDKDALGAGGMAEVRRVADPTLARDMAMKIIGAELADDEVARSRFLQEAQITAQLQHPGIPAVHEVGTLPDGRAYYTMTEVRGSTLQEILSGDAPKSRRNLLELLLAASEAVAYAHERGVIHRDLKPANLMAGEFGETLVLDWGLARVIGEGDTAVHSDRAGSALATRDGLVAGTPAYMAPEQARGETDAFGPWTDVYALGAVLHHILTGRPPYLGESAADILESVRHGPPDPPSDAPPDLAALCTRAMARDPAERFGDAGAFGRALGAWLDATRRLSLAAADWHERDRASDLLWQGALVDEYLNLRTRGHDLSDAERAFGEASVVARQRVDVNLNLGRRRRRSAVALAAAAFAAIGILAWDLGFADRVSAWEDVVDLGLGPVAVGPLSTSAAGMRDHLQVHRRGRWGRIERYESVNAVGVLVYRPWWMRDLFDNEKPRQRVGDCQFVVRYDGDGSYRGTSVLDAHGREAWRFEIGQDRIGKLVSRFGYSLASQRGAAFMKVEEREGAVEVAFRSGGGQPAAALNLANGVRFERDASGRIARQTWLDAEGAAFSPDPNLQPNDRRRQFLPATREVTYEPDLRTVRFLDAKGAPTIGLSGCEEERFSLDEAGRDTEWACSIGGEPAIGFGGGTRRTQRYDARGFAIEASFFAADGKPTLGSQGAATTRFTRNDDGRVINRATFDEAGLPIGDEFGWAQIDYTWTPDGDFETELGRDESGERATNHMGFAGRRFQYDDRGNLLRLTTLGVDGEPVTMRDGYAYRQNEYDDLEREVGWSFHDVSGEPRHNENGVHAVAVTFDEQGHPVRRSFLGIDGQPTFMKGGCAANQFTLDTKGNEVRMDCLGLAGEPSLTEQGYAARTREYDRRGQLVSQTTLGPDGEPIAVRQGYAGRRFQYDEQGRMTEIAYLDPEGNIVPRTTNGVGRETSEYLPNDAVLRTNYGPNGKPATTRLGASWLTQYDRFGRTTELSSFDEHGKPTRNQQGFSTLRITHDGQGHTLSQALFDEEGKPTLVGAGYAVARHRYDRRGNDIEWSFYGVNGEPVINRQEGCARRTQTFDRHNNVTSRAAFGVDGEPVVFRYRRKATLTGHHRAETTYDERSNAVEVRMYGVDGALTDETMGYARVTRTFDSRGNVLSFTHWGADGEPAYRKDGIHQSTFVFDDRGNEVERRSFRTDGSPGTGGGGSAVEVTQVDDAGRIVQIELFDGAGNRVLGRRGGAIIRQTPNATGQYISQSFFGIDEAPIQTPSFLWPDGCARVEYGHSWTGQETGQTCVLADGTVAVNLRVEFDSHQRLVARYMLDADGKPTLLDSGVAREEIVYNAAGQPISHTATDGAGALAMHGYGFAQRLIEYDEHGLQVGERYLGIRGEPVARKGCAEIRFEWERGRSMPTSATCIDASGTESEAPPALFRRLPPIPTP